MSSKINFDNKSNIMHFAGVPTAGHSARSSNWYALLGVKAGWRSGLARSSSNSLIASEFLTVASSNPAPDAQEMFFSIVTNCDKLTEPSLPQMLIIYFIV